MIRARARAHTPGPWHRNTRPATKYNTVWSGRNKHIAKIIVDGLTDDECEANINLIAAAPELLSAMTRIEPFLDAIVCYASTCGEYEPNDIAREFRAAIAKATGGTT